MRHQAIDSSLFVQNRQRFARQMKPDSLAIFHSNDAMPRNGDQHYSYRQHSDFFYLTGVQQKDSVLIIFPDTPKKDFKEVLFIKKETEHARIWEGEKLTKTEATNLSGIEQVVWLSQYHTVLHDLIKNSKRIYINGNESQGAEDEILTRDLRLGNELMKRYPMHKYHRSQPILRNLRMIKSPVEIELIRKALQITHHGFDKVMASVKPGMWEYQLEALLTGSFIHDGAQGHAYEPIVASGSSACVLHYITNSEKCQAGDLVLLDFGAEYANYSADITRTIPVNGRFSERQATVYNAVLKVLRETKEMMVPGVLLEELNQEVGKMMSHALVDIGLLDKSEINPKDSKKQPYRRYFMHGVAHHLGLDVHDLSDRYSPFQAGMVLTCEPGIYIPEEKMGIRLENNILITDDGPVDLASDIPIEIEDIEAHMQESEFSAIDHS
ncbi:MAG: aminopeptidase P N-terminal domain-containing protein [Saprospiraceae bacterium]|nr:aminopeptidase P N-terminal domain-containing protein [Saprospiraceae bacterium]